MLGSIIPWTKKVVPPVTTSPVPATSFISVIASSIQGIFLGLLVSSAVTFFLFQKKLLPKPIALVVSKIFFYPSFPITALNRLGNYWTYVDDTVILGCAPMDIFGHPKALYDLGVRGVVNMCAEYEGPVEAYSKLGITQLRLPTIDHVEPELSHYEEAVNFIQNFKNKNEKVYVHCKAGHGRGASVAFVWMLKENIKTPASDLNYHLVSIRHVRKTLYKQKNVVAFMSKIGRTPATLPSSSETPVDNSSKDN